MIPLPLHSIGFQSNAALARQLAQFADLLEQQNADVFRVGAYRKAAKVVARLDRPVAEILASGGLDALMELPGVGRRIAAALSEMVATGHWSQLERVRGTLDPGALFRSVPGIGATLASRLCERLHIETLEQLEIAAYDGRLDSVPGLGPRRLQMIRDGLAQRLGRPARVWYRQPAPPVATLLDVDREYREKSAAGALHKISPRRFNPRSEAWLPILHTRRGSWEFTALYSNSRLAHDLDRTRDWVVIYFHTDTSAEGRCTVVTETRGPLTGKRVVRGREHELTSRAASRRVAA